MCRKSVLLLGLGMAVVAVAQDRPSTWSPADEPFPKKWKADPKEKASPGSIVVEVRPPGAFSGSCSVPLLQVTPRGNYPMPRMRPREDQGTIKIVEPPAPPCEGWNSEESAVIRVQPAPKR